MQKYILALDQGTTSSRAILFDHSGAIKSAAQKEFKQYFPKPGWVEHDAVEIWQTQLAVARDVIRQAGIEASQIAAIGVTNQRETTVVWHRETGKPIYPAIVWQDRRTADRCLALKKQGLVEQIQQTTGLVIDAYFSATKVQWILEHVEGARQLAAQGKLAFGTIDSWLIWNLTGKTKHLTEVSNACRTMLFNIHTLDWDTDILKLFDIPRAMMPAVHASSEIYGETAQNLFAQPIPISGMAGDQQAALFGQMCTRPGMLKNTYGTGCFIVLNTGDQLVRSSNNLLTTIAWQIDGQVSYALEGSIFIAGAVVQWLRDGLGLIRTSDEIEALASRVSDNDGVYFVPAFAGLGAPHWDQFARGTIVGLTRGTTAAHIARAALESIAFQTADVLDAMHADAGIDISELRVDGGAAVNDLLMQFQADLLGLRVIRPKVLETTALGAAYLAGLAVGFWQNRQALEQHWQKAASFEPKIESAAAERQRQEWRRALERAKGWIAEK